MIVGKEWIIDAAGCRVDDLRSTTQLRQVFDRIIVELGLQTIGEQVWQQFPFPGGVTGMVLLTESHLTCHTYPEFLLATFNLYCCRVRPEWPWTERLYELLGASAVSVRALDRVVSDIEDDISLRSTEQSVANRS